MRASTHPVPAAMWFRTTVCSASSHSRSHLKLASSSAPAAGGSPPAAALSSAAQRACTQARSLAISASICAGGGAGRCASHATQCFVAATHQQTAPPHLWRCCRSAGLFWQSSSRRRGSSHGDGRGRRNRDSDGSSIVVTILAKAAAKRGDAGKRVHKLQQLGRQASRQLGIHGNERLDLVKPLHHGRRHALALLISWWQRCLLQTAQT